METRRIDLPRTAHRLAALLVIHAFALLCSAEESAEGYLIAARQAMQNRDRDQAAANYLKAISLDPSNADAQAELGVVYFDMEKLKAAEARFSRSLSLDPQNLTAKLGMARVYICKGESRKAQDLLKEVEAAGVGRPACPSQRGPRLLQVELLGRARRELRGSSRTEIKDVTASVRTARMYNRLGEYKQAIEFLTPIIADNPDVAMLHVQLGIADQGQGHLTEAKESFDKAIELSKDGDPAAAMAREQLKRMGK